MFKVGDFVKSKNMRSVGVIYLIVGITPGGLLQLADPLTLKVLTRQEWIIATGQIKVSDIPQTYSEYYFEHV
jgi:hypothetical protein